MRESHVTRPNGRDSDLVKGRRNHDDEPRV
jgi:hypothetical protein